MKSREILIAVFVAVCIGLFLQPHGCQCKGRRGGFLSDFFNLNFSLFGQVEPAPAPVFVAPPADEGPLYATAGPQAHDEPEVASYGNAGPGESLTLNNHEGW